MLCLVQNTFFSNQILFSGKNILIIISILLTLSPLSLWNGFAYLRSWSYPLLQIEVSVNINNRMANSVDLNETAHEEPSHLDLHCLHRYLCWSARLKGLNRTKLTIRAGWSKPLLSTLAIHRMPCKDLDQTAWMCSTPICVFAMHTCNQS